MKIKLPNQLQTLKVFFTFLFISLSTIGFSQDEFITTWKTSANDRMITVPAINSNSYTYDYTVDWGDGTSEANVTGPISHTYDSNAT